MLRCESADMGTNSFLTFSFSSGLYTHIVHPTLSSPPQSWSIHGHEVVFKPVSVEGDLNFTPTKVQVLCSLTSSSSSSSSSLSSTVTLSLYPTTHKMVLQGQTIPSWFVNKVLGVILSASASRFTIPQLELLEQAIASFQPPPSPLSPPPQSPPANEEPVHFGSTDIWYRHTPTKGICLNPTPSTSTASSTPLSSHTKSSTSVAGLHLTPVVLLHKLLCPLPSFSPPSPSFPVVPMSTVATSYSSSPSSSLSSVPVVPMPGTLAATSSTPSSSFLFWLPLLLAPPHLLLPFHLHLLFSGSTLLPWSPLLLQPYKAHSTSSMQNILPWKVTMTLPNRGSFSSPLRCTE